MTSVSGSMLPSGLIVMLSGVCALAGNAGIEIETIRQTVNKTASAFIC